MAGLMLIAGGLEGREERGADPGRGRANPVKPTPVGVASTGARPAAGEAELRLTRRGRLVLVTFAAAVGLVIGFLGGRVDAAASADASAAREVVVEEGDTVWGFAQEVAEPGQDVRDVVLAIQRHNAMATATLVPGDVLLLPGG